MLAQIHFSFNGQSGAEESKAQKAIQTLANPIGILPDYINGWNMACGINNPAQLEKVEATIEKHMDKMGYKAKKTECPAPYHIAYDLTPLTE